ncbi:hypothetical protein PJ267_04670 [Arthrobacter sp. OVS8]|nr:hypothetical protein PJ267_04670 [Arthrobacter sp. OVS8]
MKQETWKKYSEWPLVGAAFLFLAAYSVLIIAEPPAPMRMPWSLSSGQHGLPSASTTS